MGATCPRNALDALPHRNVAVEVGECAWFDGGFARTAKLRTVRRLDLTVEVRAHRREGHAPLVRLNWHEPVDGAGHLDLIPDGARRLGGLLTDAAERVGRGMAIAFAESRARLPAGELPVEAGILWAPADPVLVLRLLLGASGTGLRQLLLLPEEAKGLGERLIGAALSLTDAEEAA